MESLLFLAHRLPYPPNKGDKVRSCAFLKHLAARYRVFLGTFIDDPADWQHVAELERVCAGVHVEAITPWWNRLAALRGLASGEALSLAYFRSTQLRRWVEVIVRQERPRHAFIFSTPMAQYALDLPVRCLVDFVDMDSAKWGDYAARRRWPASAIYRREARRLLGYEKAVAAGAEASLFVTDEERRRFVVHAPGSAQRVLTIANGVDGEYFSPERRFDSPFGAHEQAVVFAGAMDYWPNVDAALWFSREVLPRLRSRDSAVRFYIVGMNPDLAVRALAGDAATVVTGRVADVRPYLQHASAVVAPLRVARGIQNKVLEAMAMAKPVVTTPACAAALSAREGVELATASDAQTFAAKVQDLLHSMKAKHMGQLARERVLRDYAWPASFRRLDKLLDGAANVPSQALAV